MSKLNDQINAAPEPLKSYIHDLFSGYGKSAEMVQDNIALKDTADALNAINKQLLKRESALALALKEAREVFNAIGDRAFNILNARHIAREGFARTADPSALIEAHDKKLLERVSELEGAITEGLAWLNPGEDKMALKAYHRMQKIKPQPPTRQREGRQVCSSIKWKRSRRNKG